MTENTQDRTEKIKTETIKESLPKVKIRDESKDFDLNAEVTDFMTTAQQVVNDKPTKISLENRVLRAQLVLEECLEFIHAMGLDVVFISQNRRVKTNSSLTSFKIAQKDKDYKLSEVAKELGDIDYVTTGSYVSFGLPQNDIQQKVANNNKQKLVSFNATGEENSQKVGKGKDFKPLDLTYLDK